MSWFDKAMANAGVDKRDDYGQQAIEREQNAKQEQADYDTAWNYIKHGDVSGFADYSNRNLNYRDIPFLGQFVGHAADAATQGIADLAQFTGAEGVGNYLNDAAKRGEEYLPPMSKPELSLNYITDPNGLASAFGSVTGSMLPIGAAAYLAPVGGLTAAAANVGSKAPFIGGFLGQSLPHAIRWGLTGPVEAAMEAGGAERDMREQGMSNEEARQKAWDVFGNNALLLGITNGIGGAALPHIFKGITKAAQNGSRLAGAGRFAGATGTEVGINALEEGEQQGIQNSVMGKPYSYNPVNWSEDQKEAAEFGVAGTAPFALFGLPATIRGMRNSGNDPLRNDSLEQAQALIDQQNQEAQGRIFDEAGMQKILNQIFNDTYNQSDQFAESQPAPTISAENSLDGFDNRYVSKWESKPGATDLANVQQSVKNAFNAAIAEYGDGVTLTGGAEKGYHATGAEGHEGGWKIDVDKASVKDPQKFLQAMAKYGFQVGDEGDHYDLSGHAKGGVGGTVVATPDSFVSDSGQATSGTGKREGHANAWAVYDVFRNAGYSDEAIAGILGRLQQEHNFSTEMAEEKDVEGIGRVGGYGMFQWQMDPEHGGRGNSFLQWAQENNLDPQNPTVQAQYALIEAQQRGLTPERMNQLTAEEAADLWTDEWEVGKRGNERQYAAEWRDRIKNGGNAGGSTDISIPSTKVDTSEEDRAFAEYNKQLDELAEKGIEAPFKTEQPTQKELVQQAKDAAIDAGDMDEVQRINSAERSGNTEELAKIADKAFKAKQKEVKGKSAPTTSEIKMASPNLINQVKQLLNTAKEQGVKLDENHLENTLKDGSEENLQNFAGMLQSMINAQGYENRLAQGKQLLEYADNNRIDLAPGLRAGLVKGYPKAIEAGQSVIDQANAQRQAQQNTPVAQPTISNQEQVQPQTAQNQPMQLQNGITPVQMTNAYNAAMAPMAETKEQRIKQSNAILTVARGAGVEIPKGMKSALREGSSVAIPKAQEIINNAGVTVPTAATTNNAGEEVQQPTVSNMEKVAPQVQEQQEETVSNEDKVDNSGDKSAETKKATDKKDSDNELSQQNNGGKIEVETKESSKPENKLQRMRRGREELEAVAKKYENGEITQTDAYSQVAKIAKEIATVPKDGVPNATFIDGKMKQELNDYGDRLIDEAFEAAEKSTASKSKFKEISDILSKYEKGEKNLIPIEDLMKQVHSLKTLSKEQMQALDERAAKIAEKDLKEVVENEQQGESGSPAGGHAGVRAGESRTDEREGTGEVSERDGREGSPVHEDTSREDSERPAATGVREGTELEETAGNGTDKRGNQTDVSLTEAEANPSPTEIPGNDYEIKDTDQSTKSEKVRFKQNVDAIKLLKQLEADDRMPTPAEQEVLAAYNGWGGLKNAFLDGNEMNKELRDILTDEEYKAAQSTINDAFYTPPKIIRAIWEGVSHLGFKGGRILDPSMGVGNFFGTMPRDMMEKSALRGVELDNLTSRFAKMLYPSAFVENKGFQKANVADDYFDLAISNIPFGQNMINGYQVHNYFFANGIDKVRPGGLMVYITSQGSLAGGKDAAKMRNYLENQADLIAAYKLPSGVFSDAGTQVATDIVIFRKRDKDGKKSPYGQKFGDVKEVKVGQGYYAPSYGINEYFVAHKENILGEQSTGRDQWGNTALNVKMAEGTTVADVANDLSKAMQKLPTDVYQPVSRKKSKSFDTASAQKKTAANERTRDYEYYYKDGKPVQNQNGQEIALTGQKAKVVDDYLKVKNTLNALFVAESDPKAKNKDVEGLRKKLNKDYDAFVAKHGSLTGTASKNYADDPSAGMVQALEKPVKGGKKGEVEKADIFTTRSIKAVQEVSHVETADDALIASLTNRGTVDIDYMAELTNSKPETLISKLKGKLFKNPVTLDYETRDEYLSGNVRQKLAQAKEAAKSDKAYADNVKELEKVIPEDLVSDEIFVNLGTPWIPVQDVQTFVDTLADNVHVSFSRGAALWTVTGWGRSAKYKLNGIDFPGLLNHVLNNKAIQIYDGSGEDRRFNQEKTDAANVAAEELQQDFKDWIWKDKEREKRLVRYYNDNYNNTVVRQYDGSHLNLHTYGMNAKIELKPHQKDVVWRMLQGGNTLIAHCVGAGKTFEMQAAGMEMRRLGIANKPMYCLPNNVVEQFAREFRQLYPNAKLLVLQSNDLPAVEKTSKLVKTEDGRTKRESLLKNKTPEQVAKIMEKRTARNRMLNRIRTEDWDGIIISHNLFQRFPVTPETAADFIQQEIDTLEQTIREAKQDRMDSRALSNLETSKKNLQERLEEVISTDVEDIGVPFEELGIDQLFVDEADMFKNLAFATRLGSIRGLSNSKANRSQDMFLKTQWLTNNMNGRGVVFATGTPVSNTMSELYTMMRYLDMKGLKEKGLEVFDNWMRTFGDIGQGIERKPTGDGFRKVTMIKRFINMAELTKMFRSFADVKVQDELNLDIPKLKNDKSTVIALEPDEKVVNYIKNVVPERVKNMKSGFKKEKGEDNMLSLTNDLRKLSLTDSKIEACADAIAKKYHDTADVKGTQLVFCDMGIPKAESDKASGDEVATTFDVESPEVYRSLIAKLKEKGIPDKDIAFIQNYNTKAKRDNVFQQVDSGDIRILIGSTETMGAGTNCQTHLVALHDLDAPWRPRDLEQRHGRILRQGNENKEVEIFNYVVKDSFDANMWEKLKNKAAIIQQAMSGDMNMRTVEDADLVTLSYAEVEGAATGNPLIKEQLQVQNDLTKYQHAQTAFRKKIRDAENTLAGSEESIAEQERVIAKIEKDIAQRKDTKGEKFSMQVNGKGYKDRTKADEALANILKNYKQQKSMEIGQIGGFRLTALYRPDGGLLLQLVNNRAYEVKTHSVAGIENTLRNGPEKSLEYRQKDLDAYKKNVAQAQEIIQQENPYAEKVKELSNRLNQLNREIEATLVDDGNKTAQAADTSIDSEPETETKEPAKEEKPVVKEEVKKSPSPKATSYELVNDNENSMEDASAANKPAVREYKAKIESILSDWKSKKTTKSHAEVRIKEIMGEANQAYWDKKLSNDEKLAVQGYASNAYGILKGRIKAKAPVSDRIIVSTVPPAGKSTANVNVDEFEHTKTGKMIPAASLKDHVDKDFRKQATAIAKNHGGKWSPFAKRILFKTEQGRDDFVREVEALLSANEGKASAEGEIAKAVRNAKIVDNADLTPQQRKMSEFGKQMGTPILWISTNPNLHGFYAPNGTTVLNVRSNMDLSKTFWHEAFHWVAGNNEGLYNELLDYFKGKSAFSTKQLDAYRKRIGRPGISDELAMEEMLADYFEEVKDRVKIFKEMGAEQPSLARKFVAWVKRIMDKFAEFFHNPEGKLTTAQRDSFVKAFGRLAQDMKDGEGRPIFKVYKEGKDIRLTNGQLVTEGIKLSAKNDIDNGDKVGDNEDKIESVKVNNRLSLRQDGHFDVKLLKPRPNIGVESSNDRVKRRREEIEDMDRLLQLGNNPDAYAELLSDRTLDQIEEYRNRMGWNYVRLAQEYERKYNGFFAKYSPKVTEENVIGALMNLKGAIRYARQHGNISRRNRYAIGRNSSDGRKLSELGADNTTGTRTGRTEQVTSKHSELSAFFDGANMSFVSADVAYNEALYRYQNAKSDSEKEKAYAELKRLVEQAAAEAGFENAIPEQTVAYKTRTKAAPKKSIKVYKVFTVSNDGSPTALFIGGTEKLPQGVWLDAQDAYHFKAANGKYYVPSTQNPYTKGGKTGVSVEIPNDKVRQELIKRGFLKKGSTATKVTALAYRPGWHAGTMPFFPQGGMKPPKGMNSAYPNIHRYNQVVFECELAADKDYTQEAENQPKARKKDGSLDTRNADLQYMPEDGYYYYATNPLTHGHPELGMWAISGSLKINRALSQEECDKILTDNNMAPQEWEQGEMKLEDLGYTGQQYDAARKTLAPITYDDNGKVIPLSERFNPEVNDIRFSYGPSDNSSEGLWHRIKNIMSGKGNEDSEKFRYRKHLTEMIEKALDVKLRYGKMDGKKDVVYKPENRVLRSRHAFDWENILPVAGRIAAEQLEIEPTESMNNYIADWILTGAPNNVSKEADTFHKAMREHLANSAKLEDLRDAFAEWLGKDYREQMQGTIQWKNKQKTTMQERKNKFYEEFVEELEPINRMVKQVNANLTEKGQSKLGVSADPMIAFRMLRGSYGRAMTALEGVNEGAVDALKHAFPNVDFTGFKTLYQILKSIDAFQNAEKQRDFVTYCTACHIMDMHQHNDDIRQEQQHLKNKIEKLGTSKEDEKQKAEYEKDIEKLSNELMPIPAAYSKDNCQKYINNGYDKYHNAQQDLVHFSNTTAAMLADSGVISEKRFKELLTKWQNYVPLFRVFEDNEDINFGDSMKHIKGSTRDIVNPLESIIRNTAQFIQKAELNKAKCLLADVARCDASGWLLEEVDKSDSDKTTITFWENGQRKYLQTDPDIVRAVNNMGADGSHFFIKFLHAITRLARACFTMASPEFALRNVARDWQDATLYTKYGMWVNPLDIVRGFIHAWKKDDVFYEWLTQGAAQASALSLDRDYTQSTLDKLGRGYWKRLASKDFHHALLEGLQMAGEYSEYGTRIAMYQKTKAAILKDKPNATKQELHEAMLEAAFESRDLMDFARHGKAGAEYNKITAFVNASIQGWDKLYRSLDFKNAPKRATRVAAKLVLYGALPAMMIFAMYHDDDWYKDAPNWLKETHWLFKFGDTTIRIPKAADMGIRFISNAVEKGLDEAYNKHPHKAKEYFLPMWDALPGMLPTSILPIIEIQANHSFFTDRPIIPQGQEKLPAKLQYGPYTTSLAKWIGETFDIAPRSVEHFVAGYTGTLGMAIPKAIDLVSGQNQQSLSLEEMPLIRGYLYPQFKSPQSVNDYYEKLNEQTKLKNEYKLTHKRPEGFDPALLKRLESAQKQLRKISKQEKSIIDSDKWSISDKEVMQRNIQKKRIEIAKRALGTK